jgi:hypothetical protein
MSELNDKSTNTSINTSINTSDDVIPFVVFDYSNHNDSSIEYGTATNEKLYDVLIELLKDYMERHEFLNNLESDSDSNSDSDSDSNSNDETDSELTCRECGCRVVSKKYIIVTDKGNMCRSCKPLEIIVDKEVFTKFTKFLKKNGENCDIIYFKDGKWCDFKVI